MTWCARSVVVAVVVLCLGGAVHAPDGGPERRSSPVQREPASRTDRPTTPDDLEGTLRPACTFSPPRMLGDDRISAHLATPAAHLVVPTDVTAQCGDHHERHAPWLAHLAFHPFRSEVRGKRVDLSGDDTDLPAAAHVGPPDATSAVAERVVRHYCAYGVRPAPRPTSCPG